MTKQTARLKNSNFKREEHAALRWVINVPSGTTLKDLVTPDFYANIANQLGKNHYIRALFDDGSYVVDLLVTEVDTKNQTPVWVKTVITNLVNIAEAKIKSEEIRSAEITEQKIENSTSSISHPDYDIKFRGVKKFTVLRKSDGTILQENLLTKEAANEALKDLIEKLS